jgi:hypothetical protein
MLDLMPISDSLMLAPTEGDDAFRRVSLAKIPDCFPCEQASLGEKRHQDCIKKGTTHAYVEGGTACIRRDG